MEIEVSWTDDSDVLPLQQLLQFVVPERFPRLPQMRKTAEVPTNLPAECTDPLRITFATVKIDRIILSLIRSI